MVNKITNQSDSRKQTKNKLEKTLPLLLDAYNLSASCKGKCNVM
jgi:hypothetical protein